MNAQHITGKLILFTQYARQQIRREDDSLVAEVMPGNFADARRLVACWNKFDGISTENVEDNLPVKELANRYNDAIAQSVAMLSALINIERRLSEKCTAACATRDDYRVLEESRSAIAKATGIQS